MDCTYILNVDGYDDSNYNHVDYWDDDHDDDDEW